jgi:hypothetical protein
METTGIQLREEELQKIADAVAAKLGQHSSAQWLTVKGASVYTSLSPAAIRLAAKRGKVVSHKGASGRVVFRPEELDAFMSEGGAE